MKKILIMLLALGLYSSVCFADNIYLKDGTVIKNARIIGRNSYSVTVSGRGRIFMTDIDRIGKEIEEDQEELPEVAEPETPDLIIEDKPKKELILDLLVANGMKETLDKNFLIMLAKLPKDKQEEMNELLDARELLESVVPAYDKYFTAEEVKSLILFYKSPAGAKMIKETPNIMTDVMKSAIGYFKGKMDEVEAGQQ